MAAYTPYDPYGGLGEAGWTAKQAADPWAKDPRSNPNNIMGNFYNPETKQGYSDFLNPSLQVSPGGQAVAPGTAGYQDPNPTGFYSGATGAAYGVQPGGYGYSPPASGSDSSGSAAQQAYSTQAFQFPQSAQGGLSFNAGGSAPLNGGTGSTGTSTYNQYQGGSSAPPYAPQTSGGYSPTAGGYQPQGPSDATWWGDPAQATLENAFSQYGQSYLNPTNAQQLNATNPYGQQLQGEMLGRNASALYGNTTNSQTNLGNVYNAINQPSELAQNQGQLQGIYGQANNAQGYLGGALNGLGQPTALDQASGQISGLYGGANAAQNYNTQVGSSINRPSELANASGALSGIYNSADNSSNYLQQIAAQVGGPGALEKFAASSLTSDDPYYNRIGQQGRAAIDASAAARGAYGSGGALAALGNYQSGLDAEKYQQQGQLQGSAQAAQQARLGLGGQLSQAADASTLNRGNALSNLAQGMFSNRMQSAQLGGQLAQASDAGQLNQGNALANLNQNLTQNRLQSTALGGQLSSSADASGVNQGNALAGMYQNMFGDRLAGQQLGVSASSAADASNIARLAGMTNMVNNGDQTTLARLAGQGTLANQADTTGLNYLNSYFNQAGAAQGAGANRVNSQQDRALQEAIAQASLYGGFYGQGGQQSVEAGVGSANAGANAAQLTGQGQNSGYQNLLNLLGLGAAVAK